MTFVCIFLFRRHVLMAFATPSNPSTKGTSNYAQLCRLLVEVGSHVLKEKKKSLTGYVCRVRDMFC